MMRKSHDYAFQSSESAFVTVVRSDESWLDQAEPPMHFMLAFLQNEEFPFVLALAFCLCLLEQ